jgi:hypothetical protein
MSGLQLPSPALFLYLPVNLMFCYSISYQYSETNVMPFLFNLLRIKGLYMLRGLLAQTQEALNKRHLVYCVRIVGWLHQDCSGCNKPSVVCVSPPEDEHVMLETRRGP